jgi:genome maintenance exonuclease 1
MVMFVYCPPKELPDLKSVTKQDGTRHYAVGKDLYPSVTTVLGERKKEFFKAWRAKVGEENANRISKAATGRGTNVHKLCEQYLNNETIPSSMPDALEMFLSIKPLLNNINNIHYQEQALWSTHLKLAGRVDCIAEYNGVLSVIDFKTSKKPKEKEDITDYFWQTTAYSLMYEELVGTPIHQVVIIMAVENNAPLVFTEKVENHIEGLVKEIKWYRSRLTK